MKVLMVTPYPPQPDGIGNHTAGLVDALRSAGIHVDVLTLRLGDPAPVEAHVHRVLRGNPASLPAAVHLLDVVHPDIVHVQFAVPAFGVAAAAVFSLVVAARRRGVPVVCTAHEVRRELDLLGPPGRLLYRVWGSLATRVVVHTSEAADLLVTRLRVTPERVRLLPLAARTPDPRTHADITSLRERYGLGDRPVVLTFGYIHVDKGIAELLDAAALLPGASDPGREPVVVVAGEVRERRGVFRLFGAADGRYDRRLRERASGADLAGRVRFLGFVPADDASTLFRAAAVVVVPYTKATQSSVLATAIAAGSPIVASDLPGLAEALDGAGMLVPPAEPAALAQAIASVLDDPGLAQRLRIRLERRARDLAYRRVAELHRSLYEDLAPRSRPARPGEPAPRQLAARGR